MDIQQFKDEMDLQEHTRMATTYLKINQIVNNISDLDVFPSLVWVWTWDMVKSKLDYFSPDSGEEYVTSPRFTEEDVWWMFVQDINKNNFSLEYGEEQLDEAIFDWMTDRGIIAYINDEEMENEDE